MVSVCRGGRSCEHFGGYIQDYKLNTLIFIPLGMHSNNEDPLYVIFILRPSMILALPFPIMVSPTITNVASKWQKIDDKQKVQIGVVHMFIFLRHFYILQLFKIFHWSLTVVLYFRLLTTWSKNMINSCCLIIYRGLCFVNVITFLQSTVNKHTLLCGHYIKRQNWHSRAIHHNKINLEWFMKVLT